ncbi:MAG: glycosyltransferase family 2 protein [Candidatus Aminicenantes bacterium]|nr:glycosyltransferase family 2 protein [Candidatus Aminicenantes bacterium]
MNETKIKPENERSLNGPSAEVKPLVSLVVPAYNEAEILEKNLNILCQYMQRLESDYRWELLIVNDGSADATGDIADAFAAGRTNVIVLHHMFNFRLGQALRYAFHRSSGDIVVVIDIDLSYAPDHIGVMLAKLKETRAKIVIASPYRKGGQVSHVPWGRRLLSRWANRFLCLMATKDYFSDKLTTITGMVRAYDGLFIRRLSLWAMDVDINPEIIHKAKILRARIVEVPARLNWQPKRKGAARTKRSQSTRRILRSIIQSFVSGYMFRPFMFFIMPGLVLFLLSLYPLIWTVIHTVDQYRKLAGLGLTFDYRLSEAIGAAFNISPHAFIVGGIALMVSIQLISLGLLALQKKRYFAELFFLNSTMYRDHRNNGRPKKSGPIE